MFIHAAYFFFIPFKEENVAVGILFVLYLLTHIYCQIIYSKAHKIQYDQL